MSTIITNPSGSAPMTGAAIKTAYESQPDTNEFNDAEKSKLATVVSMFASVAALLASNETYADSVAVRTVSEGFCYEAVSANGHVTNAGGQQFIVVLDGCANVRAFGALGDGVADDTVAVQAAIDAAEANSTSVYFPAGTYMVSNLVHGNNEKAEWWGDDPRRCIIRAIQTVADNGYLVASRAWLNGGVYASHPTGFHNLGFEAAGYRDFALILRTYFTKLKNCRVQGATDTDLVFSTDARNGDTLTGSTMVNNVVEECWIGVDSGNPSYNLRTIDTAGKATDYHIIDNYFSGATDTALSVTAQSAGWYISGNHFYGAPKSIALGKGNIGTRVVDNYFEAEAFFYSGGAGYPNVTIGPGNYFLDHVWGMFLNNGATLDQIVLCGNSYGAAAELRHNWNGTSKHLHSIGEVFRNSSPFQFYSNGGVSAASAGVITVENAVIADIEHRISASFSGPSASSALEYPPRPADLLASHKYAAAGSAGWHHKGGNVAISDKFKYELAQPSEALSITVRIPLVPNDGGFLVEVSVAQKQFHSGPQRTTFHRKYGAVKKSSNGVYYFTALQEVFDAAEWTVTPAISAADSGDFTDITFTGTVATTDGYGPAIMEVKAF